MYSVIRNGETASVVRLSRCTCTVRVKTRERLRCPYRYVSTLSNSEILLRLLVKTSLLGLLPTVSFSCESHNVLDSKAENVLDSKGEDVLDSKGEDVLAANLLHWALPLLQGRTDPEDVVAANLLHWETPCFR